MMLYLFEIKKFVINRKNMMLGLILSSLLFLGLYFFVFNGPLTAPALKAQLLSSTQQLESSSRATLNGLSKNDRSREFFSKNEEYLEKQIIAIQKNDINQYYDLELQRINFEMKNNQQVVGLSVENLEAEKSYIQLVQSRGLNFEIMPSGQIHAFGQYVRFTFGLFFSSLFLFAFSLFVSIDLSSFLEKKENHFFNFAGIGSLKNILTKVITSVLLTMLWIILLSVIDIVIVGVTSGFGSFNYPAVLSNIWGGEVATTPDNISISNGQVILLSLFYLFIILVFLSTLGALLSALTKRALVVAGIIAVFVVGWSLVENQPAVQGLRRFVPMSYLNPVELLCHPSYLMGNFSYLGGIVYLMICSLIFLFLANLVYKNYKIRRI